MISTIFEDQPIFDYPCVEVAGRCCHCGGSAIAPAVRGFTSGELPIWPGLRIPLARYAVLPHVTCGVKNHIVGLSCIRCFPAPYSPPNGRRVLRLQPLLPRNLSFWKPSPHEIFDPQPSLWRKPTRLSRVLAMFEGCDRASPALWIGLGPDAADHSDRKGARPRQECAGHPSRCCQSMQWIGSTPAQPTCKDRLSPDRRGEAKESRKAHSHRL